MKGDASSLRRTICPRALVGHPGLFRASTAVRLHGKGNQLWSICSIRLSRRGRRSRTPVASTGTTEVNSTTSCPLSRREKGPRVSPLIPALETCAIIIPFGHRLPREALRRGGTGAGCGKDVSLHPVGVQKMVPLRRLYGAAGVPVRYIGSAPMPTSEEPELPADDHRTGRWKASYTLP